VNSRRAVLGSRGDPDDLREGSAMSELFDELAEQRRERSEAARPRVLEADRRQVALEAVRLDDRLERSLVVRRAVSEP